MKTIICILVVACCALGSFLVYLTVNTFLEPSTPPLLTIEERAERMIPPMERARDAHQYFVDNPDKAWWNVEEEQDEDWVIIYDEVIYILEEVSK